MNQSNQDQELSRDSEAPSTVQRLAAVPLAPRRPTAVAPNPQSPPRDDGREQRINAKIQHNGQIIAVIHTLAKILAVRLYLFFVLIGAFVLGMEALDKGTYVALAVLIAYAVLTVIPLCILDDRLHRRPDQ